MTKLKAAILREEKVPHDKRVPFTPEQCHIIKDQYPHVELSIQRSPWRCYSDAEYEKEGITLIEDVRHCDVLMGIKEVPLENLIPGKKYLFFSHTIKKQPRNKTLLQNILEN